MKLDKNQELAANYISQHSLIIAGAGTGKTTTLLKKVENLINSGVKENEILVISYTNETVNNFIQKCRYNINVLTFHKLAYSMLNDEYMIANDETLTNIIYEYLNKIPLKLKKRLYFTYNYKIYTRKRYYYFLNDSKSVSIINVIKTIILNAKTNLIDLKKLNAKKFNKKEQLFLYIIINIIDYYNNYLKSHDLIDFDDMIIKATFSINNNRTKHHYKYILVDEYQDISKIRLNLLKELVKHNNAVLTAVGDDYQAIYGFSGSNISLFYNFKNDFLNAKIFYINKTYRCPQEIINKAGSFIIKNKQQIKKKLDSTNKKTNSIHKIFYKSKTKTFNKLIYKFIGSNKSILFLSRNNYDIYSYLNNNFKFIDSYLSYKNQLYKNIRFLTIHKSKGLEADIVVILNLTNKENGLPSKKTIKILNKIIPNTDTYKYSEERRLFYVALTRAKESLYLIIDKNNPSIFTKEI